MALDPKNLPEDLNEVAKLISKLRSVVNAAEKAKADAITRYDAEIAEAMADLKVLETHYLKKGLFDDVPDREGFELVAVRKEKEPAHSEKGEVSRETRE